MNRSRQIKIWQLKEVDIEQKKLVRTCQSHDYGRTWLPSRPVPVKKYFKQPIQLDLVEYITQKEKK